MNAHFFNQCCSQVVVGHGRWAFPAKVSAYPGRKSMEGFVVTLTDAHVRFESWIAMNVGLDCEINLPTA